MSIMCIVGTSISTIVPSRAPLLRWVDLQRFPPSSLHAALRIRSLQTTLQLMVCDRERAKALLTKSHVFPLAVLRLPSPRRCVPTVPLPPSSLPGPSGDSCSMNDGVPSSILPPYIATERAPHGLPMRDILSDPPCAQMLEPWLVVIARRSSKMESCATAVPRVE